VPAYTRIPPPFVVDHNGRGTRRAAAGVGRPLKYRLSTVLIWTLKRAKRRAPQTTKRKAASTPSARRLDGQEKTRMPGATLKAITSARESYSTPKRLVLFV